MCRSVVLAFSLSSVLAKNKSLCSIAHATPDQAVRACRAHAQPGEPGASRGQGRARGRGLCFTKRVASALRFPNSGSAPPGARGPSSLVCVYFFIKDSRRQGGGDVCGRPSAKRGRQSSCHYVKELTDCQKGAPGHTDAAGRARRGSPGHGVTKAVGPGPVGSR